MRRWRQGKCSEWAARFGILALVLNALVPVHIAFDLAAALAPRDRAEAAGASLQWRLLALLSLHDEAGEAGHHGRNQGAVCPICSALGTLAAAALPAAPALSVPLPIAASIAPPAVVAEPAVRFPAGYRSRAPPGA